MKEKKSQVVKLDGREVLRDVSPTTGKERPWVEKKERNMTVKEAYQELVNDRIRAGITDCLTERYSRKVERLHLCGEFLTFDECECECDGQLFLKAKSINSCRVRLCPLCIWRRSHKLHSQMFQIMGKLEQDYDFVYLMLTLTVPTVEGQDLKVIVDEMMAGLNRFFGYKRIKQAVKGWYRAMEITHDVNPTITQMMYKRAKGYYDRRGLRVGDDNPNYDKYHPHFHVILAVNKSYFHSRDYIQRDEWLALWQKAMRNPSITQVDVRRCKPKEDLFGQYDERSIASAICEVAKYTVKDTEYITDDLRMTCSTVAVLDEVLHRRRLVAFGGVFKEVHRELNLDDPIDGDLLDVGEIEQGNAVRERTFFWHWGYKQYLECDGRDE